MYHKEGENKNGITWSRKQKMKTLGNIVFFPKQEGKYKKIPANELNQATEKCTCVPNFC